MELIMVPTVSHDFLPDASGVNQWGVLVYFPNFATIHPIYPIYPVKQFAVLVHQNRATADQIRIPAKMETTVLELGNSIKTLGARLGRFACLLKTGYPPSGITSESDPCHVCANRERIQLLRAYG